MSPTCLLVMISPVLSRGGGGLGGIVGGVIGGSDQGVVSRGTPRISGDGLTMSDEVKLVFDKYTKLPTATAAVTAEKTD